MPRARGFDRADYNCWRKLDHVREVLLREFHLLIDGSLDWAELKSVGEADLHVSRLEILNGENLECPCTFPGHYVYK